MNSIKAKFPMNEDIDFEIGKPVVILGANGSGKTRLSVKIEELNDPKFRDWKAKETMLIHRISAQKSLSINDSISVHDLESSSKYLYYGGVDPYTSKVIGRFNNSPATLLLNDYDKALSLLFAKENAQLQEAHSVDKDAFYSNSFRPAPITTVVEQATQIWNELLPKRKIDLSGNGVHVCFVDARYHGKEMSDGERVMLYMICQALTLKPNSVLLVDEPELHIHKAIVNKLWDMLEAARQDCVFVYITHDLDFAMSRNPNKVLWVKSYDGSSRWDYEFISLDDYSDLPPQLIFEIIGTQKKIIFVEGDKNSLDYLLYQEIYKERGYHVIPCGGCQEVIRYVRSKRGYESFSSIEVYGVVDRDFRTDIEIAALEKDGVYCLKVAEVENLFIVPELLEIMNSQFGCKPENFRAVTSFIDEMFSNLKENQIKGAFFSELGHQLSLAKNGFSNAKLEVREVKAIIDENFDQTKLEEIIAEKRAKYESAITLQDKLLLFNFKDMSKKIGVRFGMLGQDYPRKVINYLKYDTNGAKKIIIDSVKPYIPDLP